SKLSTIFDASLNACCNWSNCSSERSRLRAAPCSRTLTSAPKVARTMVADRLSCTCRLVRLAWVNITSTDFTQDSLEKQHILKNETSRIESDVVRTEQHRQVHLNRPIQRHLPDYAAEYCDVEHCPDL